MNFKELREANLSKAQIKKVHDKADDLPKNDFIKRYGKEGDAVRFATATNIVKKQLGIDEAIKGNDFVGVSSSSTEYKQGKQAAKDGKKYDDNPYKSGTREMNIKRLNWSSGHNNFREELDKEDEKSVGRVIKGLKKAVKAHQGQVDALTKDIKDEVEEGFKNDAQRQAAVASLYSKLGLKGASKRSREKDKGKKKEEVELDEVHFSNRGEPPAPKGMHKLRSGRNIPSSSQADKIHKKVVAMTDRNDHSGARIEIAKACGDKQLVQIFNALELMHDKYGGAVGNDAIALRGKMMTPLNKAIENKFGKYADVIQDAL